MMYVFGECVLDTQCHALTHAGQPVHLRAKAFALLVYLLHHRDRAVSKDELCAQVWPEQFISDATLGSTVRTVRQAIGDRHETQRLIQTVHGYGYRFVAPLVESVAASQIAADLATTPDHAPPEARSQVPAVAVPAPITPAPSRRQLTILFCDLVDSIALASRLDPEDLQEVVLAYHALCAEVIERFDGSIAQYLGYGLLSYFGYPQAHEDAAQRAVRSGLGIVEAIGSLHTRLERGHGVRLAVRLGVHTGLVIVGAVGGSRQQEPLAFGATPHVAIWLQSLAGPNQMVLSAHTQQLAGGEFVYEDLGVQALQGDMEPIRVYSVRGERSVASRFEAATTAGLTPLVGRDEEIGLLLRRWTQAREGEGQVVVLAGEPGIGKSRLIQTLCERIAAERHIRVQYQCSPYYTNSAFYPIIRQLERMARFLQD